MNSDALKCSTAGCGAPHVQARPARAEEQLELAGGFKLPTLVWECVCGWKVYRWKKAEIPSPEG